MSGLSCVGPLTVCAPIDSPGRRLPKLDTNDTPPRVGAASVVRVADLTYSAASTAVSGVTGMATSSLGSRAHLRTPVS